MVTLDDETTSDVLDAYGFVPARALQRGVNLPYAVHNSVGRLSRDAIAKKEHPYVVYTIGYGYEAVWGAVRFDLRTIAKLEDFMRVFDYKLPEK